MLFLSSISHEHIIFKLGVRDSSDIFVNQKTSTQKMRTMLSSNKYITSMRCCSFLRQKIDIQKHHYREKHHN